MRRLSALLILTAAAFVGIGGFIHLREWFHTYRHVPSSVPGAAVVRIGFPANAGLSLVVAAALITTVFALRRFAPLVVAGAFAFQAASLGALILSHTANLAGWMEAMWTPGANETRVVEIAALAALAGGAALLSIRRQSSARRQGPMPGGGRLIPARVDY